MGIKDLLSVMGIKNLLSVMGIKDLLKDKKSAPEVEVVEKPVVDSDDVHEKYANAINIVLLREMGNPPKMQQMRERIMIAIKSV